MTFALLATTSGAMGCMEPPERSDKANGEPHAAGPKRTATVPADGWNDAIAWRGLDEGLREAKQSGMPLMLVVHTDWCGNCQKLKPSFARERLAQLSEQFVMVHVDQDAQPEVTLYSPDGQYIPRVLFLDPDGNIDSQLQNPNRRDRFRYFYTPQDDLVASMREALDRHGNKS
jgi:protein-disulfide reductase (glutathione)